MFGPPGVGKSHLAHLALSHALIDNGYCVLFSRTGDLVQRLQAARELTSRLPWPSSTSSTS